MKKVGKAAIAALLPLLCLFGCGRAPEYTVDAVCSVSVTCGHMDYSHSYAFYLRRAADGWLLDADFAPDAAQPHTAYEARPVSAADAQTVLDALQKEDGIGRLQRRKKPKIKVQVMDETTYYTVLGFADGESLGAAVRIDALETCFYRMAEKYGAAPQ